METIEKSGIVKTILLLYKDNFYPTDSLIYNSREDVIEWLNQFPFIKYEENRLDRRAIMSERKATLKLPASSEWVEEADWNEIRFVDVYLDILENDAISLHLFEKEKSWNNNQE